MNLTERYSKKLETTKWSADIIGWCIVTIGSDKCLQP